MAPQGYVALVLHAHLPYVRHPEHERFLEENWLFEAIAESYLPLLRVLEGWNNDGMRVPLTLTLTPTLCAMLQDRLLQQRFCRYLEGLVDLAEKETYRTHWEPAFRRLAFDYWQQFRAALAQYEGYGRDLVSAFARWQEQGQLEIITSAATHALLPLLQNHPPSLRAQIGTARDEYRRCFGRDPKGIWLPECAYAEGLERVLQQADIRWFITEAHGVLHGHPRPRAGPYAPVFTPDGLAVFARDPESAEQVWSKEAGYPGDPCYRDFYRDIGYDLDLDYLLPYLPAPPHRSFTGIKYFSISGGGPEKRPYHPEAAAARVERHAEHFLEQRLAQVERLASAVEQRPMVVAPYDAELFGHWWFEGPRFLDLFCRKAYFDQTRFAFTTPWAYLRQHPTQQVSRPSPSSWGEGGYWRVWLNEENEWIYPQLQIAQERMTELARRYPTAEGLVERALKQASRELLLAQASDWPFILRTKTSPNYAVRRVKEHLTRFHVLHEQLTSTRVDEAWLTQAEASAPIFPNVQYRYWA